ncbi:MAG TPA: alpha/beta fold hydrolase [Isosphaeraceae bacterium]|nr:alpha/beta fold hydrolase [Isosphaeraceae bacterium]
MLLNYSDDGPGPVVVLLHGFPMDHRIWNPQRASVGATYRLIAPDLRGHGASAAPEGVYSMEEMAGDVHELLDALGIHEPIVLGGHSMGGYVAQAFAARYPDRLRGLVLINTRAGADSEEAARKREETASQVEASEDVEPVVESMLPRLLSPSILKQKPKLVHQVRSMMVRTPARAVAGALRGMARRLDRLDLLRTLKTPALVLAGENDAIVPLDEARAMANALPLGQLEVIPDCGHLAPLENPDATNNALLAFLNELP